MRTLLILLISVPGLLSAQNSVAKNPQDAGPSNSPLTGRWIVSAEFYGTPLYLTLNLNQQGEKLIGDFDGDKLEGSVSGSDIHFLAKDEQGGSEEAKGTMHNGNIEGSIIWIDSNDPTHPETHKFTAALAIYHHSGMSSLQAFSIVSFPPQTSRC